MAATFKLVPPRLSGRMTVEDGERQSDDDRDNLIERPGDRKEP